MGVSDLTLNEITLEPPDPVRDHKAALKVCELARDAEDAAELLAMLGLREAL